MRIVDDDDDVPPNSGNGPTVPIARRLPRRTRNGTKNRAKRTKERVPIDPIIHVETAVAPVAAPTTVTVVRKDPMVPMTKAVWEQQQAQIREVYDEQSGRYRLVRGSGEII